jgi:flagellar hook protein FlgE
MYKSISFTALCFILFTSSLFAQEKLEKESRVKSKNVPSNAVSFIDTLNLNICVTWYRETDINSVKYEAKFIYKRKKYSFEFDSLGNIEDIEIKILHTDLDTNLALSINTQLSKNCTKHKIIKVQKQLSGMASDLSYSLKTGKLNDGMIIKYEIVAKCKQNKKVNLFEYLFNSKGLIEITSKIIFKKSSHLEY